MRPQEKRQLLSLLVKVYNTCIQDFYYFPEVIVVGRQRITGEEFSLLLQGGWIELFRFDSFGRFYRLSLRGKEFLYTETASRPLPKKKKANLPSKEDNRYVQGSLYFSC